MFNRNFKVGNRLGFTSIFLAVVPLLYIFVPTAFPENNLTAHLVLFGGVGGSLLMALGAGFFGSRWWFFALLGPAIPLVLMRFSP